MKLQHKSKKGQSMVEFALSIPFLFLIFISILYFGRYFLLAQVLLYAAQQGAAVAASTPNLSDPTTRSMVRGFDAGGNSFNPNSVIFSALNSAGLLSNGITNSVPMGGNLPSGATIQILPWDAGTNPTFTPPPGTIAVVINYPFQFLSAGPVTSVAVSMSFTAPAMQFSNFTITEQAVVAQQVYQQ